MGLDLGGLCTMGLCTISLWTLGVCRRCVGLVPGTYLCASILWTGVRWLCRRRRIWIWFRVRRRNRLVPARLWRTVQSVVPLQPDLYQQREHHQHADQ